MGCGLLAPLDHLADDRDAGGAQQLAELREVVALAQRADAEGALRARCAGSDPFRDALCVLRPLRLLSIHHPV